MVLSCTKAKHGNLALHTHLWFTMVNTFSRLWLDFLSVRDLKSPPPSIWKLVIIVCGVQNMSVEIRGHFSGVGSPFTFPWVPGIELRGSAFTHWPILPALSTFYIWANKRMAQYDRTHFLLLPSYSIPRPHPEGLTSKGVEIYLESTYLGPSHLQPTCLHAYRWGSYTLRSKY